MSKKDVEDLEFILNEIIRYLKGFYTFDNSDSPRLFIESEPQFSFFCRITTSIRKEGELVIGAMAHNRFYDIAKRIRVPNKVKIERNVANRQLVDALKKEFATLILENNQPVNESTACKIISRAKNSALKQQKVVTHYIPLCFFTDFGDEEFNFGGIKIISSEKFAKECAEDKHLRETLWSTEFWELSEFEEYFKVFNTILCIDVPSCDKEVSKQRAILCAKTFLGIIQLFVGQENGCKLRLCGQALESYTSYEVTKESDKFNITLQVKSRGTNPVDWRNFLDSKESDLARIYALTIGEILNPKQFEVLGNRLIDALLWFSEAVIDQNLYSRIVKYTIAIERLTTTDNKDVTQSVTTRASKLISLFEGDRENWKKRMSEMYELRSNIAHGSLSISSNYVDHSDHWPELITQKVILGSTIVFSNHGLDKCFKDDALKSIFEKLEEVNDANPFSQSSSENNC